MSAPVLPVDPPEVDADADDGLTEEQVRALIAIGAYRAKWFIGPSALWVADRMDWSRLRVWAELERLRRLRWLDDPRRPLDDERLHGQGEAEELDPVEPGP